LSSLNHISDVGLTADCALSPCPSRQVVPDEDHVQPAKGVKVNGEGQGTLFLAECPFCHRPSELSIIEHNDISHPECVEKWRKGL
jgi:hypothetical protein